MDSVTSLSPAQRVDLKKKIAAARHAKRLIETDKDQDGRKVAQGLMQRRAAKQKGYL
jgi:hypothetical protein